MIGEVKMIIAVERKGEQMDDMISRQTAVDAIMGQPPEPHYPSWYAEQINKLPSAQRKGRWLLVEYPDGYYHTTCSECGQWFDEDVYLKGKWSFCPNCGANMHKDDPSHPFADDVMMKGEEDGNDNT